MKMGILIDRNVEKLSGMQKSLNYRENLRKGSSKSVRIIEIFKLQRLELQKGTYSQNAL